MSLGTLLFILMRNLSQFIEPQLITVFAYSSLALVREIPFHFCFCILACHIMLYLTCSLLILDSFLEFMSVYYPHLQMPHPFLFRFPASMSLLYNNKLNPWIPCSFVFCFQQKLLLQYDSEKQTQSLFVCLSVSLFLFDWLPYLCMTSCYDIFTSFLFLPIISFTVNTYIIMLS